MEEEFIPWMFANGEELIEKLEEPYRSLMYDKFINGIKYKDMQNKYHMNVNSLKTKIRKGKRLLTDIVENED